MATDAQVNVPDSVPQGRSLTRSLIALVILLAVGIYTVSTVMEGFLPSASW
jgi:hypothetical protein